LCRKGKAPCEHPFELHRQQPEKYKQNVDVSPPGKHFVDAHGKGAWSHSNESLPITAVLVQLCSKPIVQIVLKA